MYLKPNTPILRYSNTPFCWTARTEADKPFYSSEESIDASIRVF